MSALHAFLQRSKITKANPLPLVHTTEAYFLKKIINSRKVLARPCSVFGGERLSYFFVGRAAYKKDMSDSTLYWEMPACVVLDFSVESARRIFPFDTGAFANRRYPNFVSMMNLSDYNTANDRASPHKLIGTFFVNSRRYYTLKPRAETEFNDMFDVDTLDEEVKALYELSARPSSSYDDRRFAIELQFPGDVTLDPGKVLAVIVPETYLESRQYISTIESIGAKIISYPIYPTNSMYYYGVIYEKLDHFYRSEGLYDV
jgi:hypothetical protein